MIKSIMSFLLISLSFFSLQAAGELQLLMSSRINVEDENDYQNQSCDSYRFDGKILFDNPNQLALFQNQAYRLGFDFTAFLENKQFDPTNYSAVGLRMDVYPREKKTYKVRALSNANNKVIIDLNIFGKVGEVDTIRVQLWGKGDVPLVEAIFPFQVYDASGDFSGMAVLPYMIQIEPAYMILTDVNNTNNFIQQEASLGNDPLIVKRGKTYNFEFEIEKHVNVEGEEYVVIADKDNNYGYTIRYSWDQPLQFRKSSNGFSGRITMNPDKNTRPKKPLWVNGDMTSLLPEKGKRTVQYLKFYQNDPKQNKKYTDQATRNNRIISQRKSMASLANKSFIANFQQSDLKSIEKISPKSANLKTELLKGAEFVVVAPKKNILQMEKVNTRYYFEKNGKMKPQLMVPMQKYQFITQPEVAPQTQPSNPPKRKHSNLKIQKTEQVQKNNTKINSKASVRSQSRPTMENATISSGRSDTGKSNGLHTLYIEACRETDYLDCRPFQITIKLVD
ncbi:MAG: hypothetical protein DHS20C18_17230 [Saprospiraceae bacterium]|nr:MAG: hypothetical protein DHS20C18_17230 [Saprospiraceae bacterium]